MTMIKEFHVIIEKDKDGYFARCLDLDGCFGQGDTYEAAEEDIRKAIQLHLADVNPKELREPESVSLSSVRVTVPQ